MSGFSEDGQWWWDGTTWVATARVVLPELPPTASEQSGKLKEARDALSKSRWLYWPSYVAPLAWLTVVPYLIAGHRAFDAYRTWTLEQLALATAYLLGPDEPMLNGEGSLADSMGQPPKRDIAVAVTAAHVLVLRFDSLNGGQPRTIAMVARPTDVKVEIRPDRFFSYPALFVTFRNESWAIRGPRGVFNPKPVVDSWVKAATTTLRPE